jgi:uncharacterized protein YjeT (DUF2065 family)
MDDFGTALGLVLVIEGALYALHPEGMQRMMAQAVQLPPTYLRRAGLAAAVVGFIIVWLIRG